jgi:RND family efflux transporter MFP subunit
VETPPKAAVRAVAAETVEWPSVYEAVGTVQARTASTLSAKVMGYVREMKVDAGDRVKAGQPLVTLDSRDLEAGYRQAQAGLSEARSALMEVDNAIAAAEAQLSLAEATHRRMKDLYDKKSISNQEFDEVSARLRMAQANREMAVSRKQQLAGKIQQAEEALESASIIKNYAEIAAPFDGTITEKMADPGVLAAPGMPLLRIERAGSYRLEAQLAESWLPRVRAGQEVEIRLDALEGSMRARVAEVVPAVDAASRAFTVRINLPNVANLRSGLFGRARFSAGVKRAVAVPLEAVERRGQVESVYVIEGGRARSRMVSLGERHGGMAEVLAGLEPGEKVVSPVPANLVDGAPVEVRP